MEKQFQQQVGVRNIGVYFPSHVLTSFDLAELSDIPEVVIREKFGIRQKHKAGPNENVSDLAIRAAQNALDGILDAKELDVVVYHGSEYKDYYLYNMAAKIQYEIGATRANAFEIHSLCSAGALSLKVAKDMMLQDEELNNVLLVTATKESDLIDYKNERTRFMYNFGDGAAAVLLTKGHMRNHILKSHMITDGGFAQDVAVYEVGSANRDPLVTPGHLKYYLDVADPQGMKERLDPISERNFLSVIERATEKSGYDVKDIRFLAPIHMKRSIHQHLLQSLNLTEENTYYLENYGHVQSADAYLALHEGVKSGRVKDGDLVIMLGAGTGYSWAATAIRWGAEASPHPDRI